MNTVEFFEKKLRKTKENYKRSLTRNSSLSERENLRKKIIFYEEALHALQLDHEPRPKSKELQNLISSLYLYKVSTPVNMFHPEICTKAAKVIESLWKELSDERMMHDKLQDWDIERTRMIQFQELLLAGCYEIGKDTDGNDVKCPRFPGLFDLNKGKKQIEDMREGQ